MDDDQVRMVHVNRGLAASKVSVPRPLRVSLPPVDIETITTSCAFGDHRSCKFRTDKVLIDRRERCACDCHNLRT